MEFGKIEPGPIGVFDSGYGGLTILSEFIKELPEFDYLYLGDNARAPYGTRSFDLVYEFTWQAVKFLFDRGCHLVILACNTASAKALRTVQQKDLPKYDPSRRVLGVIRPTVEAIGDISKTKSIGIFATPGTIASHSYDIEITKIFPESRTHGHACPMWVPLVENNEYDSPGADYFVKKDIDELFDEDLDIDTLILACTHYPLLSKKIEKYIPEGVSLIQQGEIVAKSLKNYLKRHPEMEKRCSKNRTVEYLTTEEATKFNKLASLFMKKEINSTRINLI